MEHNLATIAAVHGFTRVGYNFNLDPVTPDYAFNAEIWGEGIGNHGFASASGATPEKAMEAAITLATEKRALNAVPADLTGEPA